MASILTNVINNAAPVYRDDLIILESTPEEQVSNLIKLLDVLNKYDLNPQSPGILLEGCNIKVLSARKE